jgi:hypothetical protein
MAKQRDEFWSCECLESSLTWPSQLPGKMRLQRWGYIMPGRGPLRPLKPLSTLCPRYHVPLLVQIVFRSHNTPEPKMRQCLLGATQRLELP